MGGHSASHSSSSHTAAKPQRAVRTGLTRFFYRLSPGWQTAATVSAALVGSTVLMLAMQPKGSLVQLLPKTAEQKKADAKYNLGKHFEMYGLVLPVELRKLGSQVLMAAAPELKAAMEKTHESNQETK